MAETDDSKKRKPNWHKEECLLLAELVKERKTVIEGRFGPGVTSANRHEAWQKITDTLNANGRQQRSKEEVIKKWKNLKSAGKSAYSTFKNSTTATGGGPPPTPISPVTEAVVDCIGRDNTVLTGIGPMSLDSSFIQLLQLDQSFEKVRAIIGITINISISLHISLHISYFLSSFGKREVVTGN
ncbi:nuclear apoptosis-inducing factor 1-like [Haliotis asinina]|uniref:nuclear apoptosis-inducing factor 1-like n=1 Tax=Haliotis asinina TaxID=109174 RepID=UPI003531D3FF